MNTGTRDLLNHGAGKGDKDRSPGWREHYTEIDWGVVEPEGFVRVSPNRIRKVYREKVQCVCEQRPAPIVDGICDCVPGVTQCPRCCPENFP